MSVHLKPVGIALTGPDLIELIGDPRLAALLDSSGLAFAVAGTDRVDATRPGTSTLESTVAVGLLATRVPRVGWLAAAAVHRDHPYNLARRVASLDHLAAGRVGLLLGLADGFAPPDRDGHEVWGGAGLTDGVPIGVGTTLDAALAIQRLWQSWPVESIVADRATGIYARGEQIRYIDHRGVFDISGPLTVPTTPQGAPVLAWHASSLDELPAAGRAADLVVWAAQADHPLGEVAAAAGSTPLYPQLSGPAEELTARVHEVLADDRVAGAVVRPEPGTLHRFLESAAPLLADSEATAGWTLRGRLGLPAPLPLLADARPAFPVPVPEQARS